MKIQISLMLLAVLQTGLVYAGSPDQEPCNKKEILAKVETSVIKDVRNKIALEPKAGAFSFRFSPIWRNKDASDLTVYFEKTTDVEADRRSYFAQYSVDAKTCAPTFKKLAAMYIDQEDSSGLQTSSPVPEVCNNANQLPALHNEIMTLMEDLVSHVDPGAHTSNFNFSGVWRVPGASDIVVYLEAVRPKLMTSPWIAQFSVDPVTCKPAMKVATAFTWLLVTY